MNKRILGVLALTLLVFTGCQIMKNNEPNKPIVPMKIESLVFTHNQYLPTKYTCDGVGANPPLKISDIPAGTQSMVLIVDDPDAPNGDFVHWLVWNIDPGTTEIAENSVPVGAIQGTSSASTTAYVAPCPPSGAHHYIFQIYSLDDKLDLPAGADKTALLAAMQGHIIGQAEIVGLFSRQ